MQEQLYFVDTLMSKTLNDSNELVLQEYENDRGDSIYNVSIEKYDDDQFETRTTDLYETEDYDKAQGFFSELVNIYEIGRTVKED